jgi:uncharacterized membrane protein
MPAVGGSNAAPAGNGGGGGGCSDNSIVYGNYATGTNYITTDPWTSWNYAYTTAGTTTAGSTTWITWNGQYQQDVAAQLTEAQLAEREILRQRMEEARQRNYETMRREQEEETRRATAARERAEELLNEMLSDEQRQTRDQHNWFAVRGSASGRIYRIGAGVVNNVSRLSEDGTVRDQVLCAHPPDIPDADAHLAQMLLLVTNEPEFVRIANKHGVAGYDAVLPENLAEYRVQRERERQEDRERRRRERGDREARYPVQQPPDEIILRMQPEPHQLDHTVEGVEMHPVMVGIDPSFRDGMFVEARDDTVTYNMRVEAAVQRGLAWVDGDVAEQGAALGH